MVRHIELRSHTDRYVLFLENPTEVYRRQVEGSTKERVDNQVRKFLEEDSPESALQDEDKFPDPLRQLKDRGGQVRALGVWCQGDGFDLFVIQILFDKDDEETIYAKSGAFQARGDDLATEFGDEDRETIATKADEWRERDDLRLCTPEWCA